MERLIVSTPEYSTRRRKRRRSRRRWRAMKGKKGREIADTKIGGVKCKEEDEAGMKEGDDEDRKTKQEGRGDHERKRRGGPEVDKGEKASVKGDWGRMMRNELE